MSHLYFLFSLYVSLRTVFYHAMWSILITSSWVRRSIDTWNPYTSAYVNNIEKIIDNCVGIFYFVVFITMSMCLITYGIHTGIHFWYSENLFDLFCYTGIKGKINSFHSRLFDKFQPLLVHISYNNAGSSKKLC